VNLFLLNLFFKYFCYSVSSQIFVTFYLRMLILVTYLTLSIYLIFSLYSMDSGRDQVNFFCKVLCPRNHLKLGVLLEKLQMYKGMCAIQREYLITD
jgi:hypothetical protein